MPILESDKISDKIINIRTVGLPLKPINEFIALQGNLKIMDSARLNKLISNILQNGFISPIFIWQNQIVDGHQRIKALQVLLNTGYHLYHNGIDVNDMVPYIVIDAIDRTEAAKFILTYNSQYGQMVGLDEFLSDFKLDWADIDKQLILPIEYNSKFGKSNNSLKANWVMPPFSILDTRQIYWQERRREWYSILGDTSFSREHVLGDDLLGTINSGVSLFDPVLAEIIFRWFTPHKNSKILNLFAGGVEPNIVAAYNGHHITGIELRMEQIEHTCRIADRLKINHKLNIICDDVLNLNLHAPNNEFDLIVSSPPFYSLEQYSTNPDDFSNKNEVEFDLLMEKVILSSASKLKDNRFAVFVVSEVRRADGSFIGFVPKVIKWFLAAGFVYYNEIVLINSIGTLPFRINRAWSNRKIGRMHQNVLVFFKGFVKNIEKEFDTTRINGLLHQKVMVFFKGNIQNIKNEFKQDIDIV